MIIDVISSSVKHVGDLDLNAPLWVPSNAEEIFVPCSHHVMDELYATGIYKYIFIEQTVDGFVERTMVSFDELNTSTMALEGSPTTPVELYPVCNKILDPKTNECHVMGFLNPIKSVLKELTGTRPDSLQSIHQSLISSLYNYLAGSSMDVTNSLVRFCEANHNQLKHTVNITKELTSSVLLNRSYVRDLLRVIDWNNGGVGDILSSAIGLPHSPTLDWMVDKPCILSTQLKPLMANGVGITKGTYVDTKPDEGLIKSTLPMEKRWVGINLTEAVNHISVSEFSVTFKLDHGKGTLVRDIHYSNSFDRRLVITEVNLLAIQEALRPIWTDTITVQKTLGNDVWVYTDNATYHFDLTMYNLCSANIVGVGLTSLL